MRPDPDLLAITRQRRQQARCVACGHHAGRATLCALCRRTLRYCPTCERIWQCARPAPSSLRRWRTSEYCSDCRCRKVRARLNEGARSAYLTQMRQHRNPHLSAIIACYRRGLSLAAIATELSIPQGTVSSIMQHAKKKGQWPKKLKRGRGWRSDLQRREAA